MRMVEAERQKREARLEELRAGKAREEQVEDLRKTLPPNMNREPAILDGPIFAKRGRGRPKGLMSELEVCIFSQLLALPRYSPPLWSYRV